jgi:ABC-type glycerol-3-phosphate transport system substrate-binding protein
MRFTSTLVLAISALTSLVAAATTTSSGENPITYPLGGSIKAGSDVTITWYVQLTI